MRARILLLLLIPFFLSLMASPTYAATTVYPSNDCDVSQNSANTNFDATWLYVRDHEYLSHRSWLMFDVPANLTIESARLYLYLNDLAFPDNTVINVHGSANETWLEETITWNNQPSYGTAIDSETVYAVETWYSWDVTANVTSGSNSSFCMIATTNYPNAQFLDKEYGTTYDPYLLLTLADEEEEDLDITVSNAPELLGNRLGISTWSAGMLLTALLLFPFNMIMLLWKKSGIVALIFNFMLLGIFFSFGWLPGWTIIIISLLIVAVAGLSIKDRF